MDQANRSQRIAPQIGHQIEPVAELIRKQKSALEAVRVLNALTREFVAEEARTRAAITRALEVLRRDPSPDTFLGRQNYELIPLPHELED